jgi:P27 family predicted phage terminase small subunit
MGTPRHLSRASAAWFEQIAAEYELGPDHYRVLQLAAESWDTMETARKRVAKDGELLTSPSGVTKAHPALAIYGAAADRFLKAVSALGLGSEAPVVIPGQRKHLKVVE